MYQNEILQAICDCHLLLEDHRLFLITFKGELQRQNKLISSERPFQILQNETKIIKIGQAVLEILNLKD